MNARKGVPAKAKPSLERRAVVHQAGHAVMAFALGRRTPGIEVPWEGASGESCLGGRTVGRSLNRGDSPGTGAVLALGGIAAEVVLYRRWDPRLGSQDWQAAKRLILRANKIPWDPGSMGALQILEIREGVSWAKLAERGAPGVDQFLARACRILEGYRGSLESLVRVLDRGPDEPDRPPGSRETVGWSIEGILKTSLGDPRPLALGRRGG